jgi:hypothetical protein
MLKDKLREESLLPRPAPKGPDVSPTTLRKESLGQHDKSANYVLQTTMCY